MSKYLIENWFKRLISAKVSEPNLSLRYILEDVLLLNLADINLQNETESIKINQEQVEKIEKLIFRREYHEPIQYILGKWPFRNLNLKMKPPVFIPRTETEKLIDIVKSFKNKKNLLEIGVGSGAISLSLLKETDLNIFAIDKSKEAIDLTNENLKLNKLNREKFKISQIDICKSLKESCQSINNTLINKCDILISNPPYIPYKDLVKLEPQILWYESVDALNGGLDGLDVIKSILEISKYILNDQGIIVLEVDHTHPCLFDYLLKQNFHWKLKLIDVQKDCFDRPRFVVLQCHLTN